MKEYKYGNITVTVKGKPDPERVKKAVREFVKAVEKERGLDETSLLSVRR